MLAGLGSNHIFEIGWANFRSEAVGTAEASHSRCLLELLRCYRKSVLRSRHGYFSQLRMVGWPLDPGYETRKRRSRPRSSTRATELDR